MGSIYKRIYTDKETGEKVKGDTYWISYSRNGKQLRESTETTNLDEAKRILAEKESEITIEISNSQKERRKFSERATNVVNKLRETWKKSRPEVSRSQPEAAPQLQSSSPQQSSVPQARERAIIGSMISIEGKVIGDEDLLIEGHLDGKIEVSQHCITVGKRGRVKADIYGRVIIIEGTVEGNLYGEEKLIVRQSATVRGTIVSPRVAVEEGSNFKGSIDTAEGQ